MAVLGSSSGSGFVAVRRQRVTTAITSVMSTCPLLLKSAHAGGVTVGVEVGVGVEVAVDVGVAVQVGV